MIEIDNIKYFSGIEVRNSIGLSSEQLTRECQLREIVPIKIGGKYYYNTGVIESLKRPSEFISIGDFAIEKGVIHSDLVYYLRSCNFFLNADSKKIKKANYYSRNDLEIEYLGFQNKEQQTSAQIRQAFNNFYQKTKDENFLLRKEDVKSLVIGIDDSFLDSYNMEHSEFIRNVRYDKNHTKVFFTSNILRSLESDGFYVCKSQDYFTQYELRNKINITLSKMISLKYNFHLNQVRFTDLFLYRIDTAKKLEKLNEEWVSVTSIAKQEHLTIKALSKEIKSHANIRQINHEATVLYYWDDIKDLIQQYKSKVHMDVKNVAASVKNTDVIITARNAATIEDMINILLSDYCDKHRGSFNCVILKEYLNDYANRSRAVHLKEELRICTTLAISTFEQLTKDLTAYSDSEIISFINNYNGSEKHKDLFAQIVNFARNKYDWNLKMTLLYERNSKKSFLPYDDDEWCAYARYISNIDIHKIKAENNRLYAYSWFSSIAYCFLAWRPGDLSNIHAPGIRIISSDGLVTECDAAIIATDIRERTLGCIASKNRQELSFPEIPRPLLVPFVVSALICNMHNGEQFDCLLPEHFCKNMAAKISQAHFFDNLPNFHFQPMRMAKTLETGIWIKAHSMPNVAVAAYTLAVVERAHKHDGNYLSNTTTKYILGHPEEKFNAELQIAFSRRGLFGFNGENILKILTYGSSSALSMVERTNAVIEINSIFPPEYSELLASNMLNSMNESKLFISRWIGHEEEFIKRFSEMILSDSNSKEDGVICSKLEKCQKPCFEKCCECFYGLFTIQMAKRIVSTTLKVINDIKAIGNASDEASQNSLKVMQKRLMNLWRLIDLLRNEYINAGMNADVILELDTLVKEVKLLNE